MPIDSRSLDYRTRLPQWKMMRAFASGGGQEKAYIRRLPGQPDDTYEAYKAGAYYLNATQRTIDAMTGLPMSRSPAFLGVEAYPHISEHATRYGSTFGEVAQTVLDEVATVNRVGLFVDFPVSAAGLTQAQAEASGAHVFTRIYKTESIIDCDYEIRGAHKVLTQVRLAEAIEVKSLTDEYVKEVVDQIRVLSLVEGVYMQTLYTEAGGAWVPSEAVTPIMNGKPLSFIPFQFINDLDSSPDCKRPLLLDVAEASKAHLNNSALHEWGLMWTGNPTPVFKGLKLEVGQTLALGSSEGIQLDVDGDAFFLEFSGNGLSSIRDAMEVKRRDMAVLGARMLLEEKKQVESEGAASIHRSGEQSILATVVNSVNRGLTQVAKWMVQWSGGNPDFVSYEISRDFLSGKLSMDEITKLLELHQAGRITRETLFLKLVAGNVIAEGTVFADYEGELEDEAVSFDTEPPVDVEFEDAG